jgi:hypothetical protein
MTTNMLCLLFMTITVLIARVTRWVSYMEQELLTLTKYLSSLFCFLCNVIVCYFRFVHCNVFSSSIYGIKVTPLLSSKCPTFIFLLVIGVEQFLNYPTFLMHFSDLILLLDRWLFLRIRSILFCSCVYAFWFLSFYT